jgi:dTMP kinase
MTAAEPDGRFVTFEGGEGAGKSTQLRRLASRLSDAGIDTLATREPGGSPHAERLREILLSGRATSLGPLGEAILFTAARIDHVDNTIAPALADGRWVVCDRFIDSTRAYQGALGRLDPAMIAVLERAAIDTRKPDLTILIDLPPELGLARAAARRGSETPDRFESQDIAFHAALRAAYLAIAKSDAKRFLIVDGADEIDAIADKIWGEVTTRFLVGAPA